MVTPYIINKPHHIVDASVAWTAPGRHIDLQLWVKNLTKEYVYVVGQSNTSYVVAPGAPRTYGATLGWHL